MPGLLPFLGVRAQAMKLVRLHSKSRGRFLQLGIKTSMILKKAAKLHALFTDKNEELYHRAYIGE